MWFSSFPTHNIIEVPLPALGMHHVAAGGNVRAPVKVDGQKQRVVGLGTQDVRDIEPVPRENGGALNECAQNHGSNVPVFIGGRRQR